MILGHNHPSGAGAASESDRMFIADVLAALQPPGVRLLDHIVIAGDNHFSFAEAGVLDEIALTLGRHNWLTPKSYNTFFQLLREDKDQGFRSE